VGKSEGKRALGRPRRKCVDITVASWGCITYIKRFGILDWLLHFIPSFVATVSRIDNVRFEVFTVVTMKNTVFWDIQTQFIPHWKHIKSLLQSPTG
jgi:hypothetical protein